MWGAKKSTLDSSFTKRSWGAPQSGAARSEVQQADFGVEDEDYRYLGLDMGEIRQQQQQQQKGKRKVGFLDDDEEEQEEQKEEPARPLKTAAKEPNPFEGWRFKVEIYRTSSLLPSLDHATLKAIKTLLTSRSIKLSAPLRQELKNESTRPDESKQHNPLIVVKRDVDTGQFNLFMREVVDIMNYVMACALGCTYDISSKMRNNKFGVEDLCPYKGAEKPEHGQKFGIVDAVNQRLSEMPAADADHFDWQVKGYFYARGELSSEEVCRGEIFEELLEDVKAILSREKTILEKLPERRIISKEEEDF